MLFVPVTCSWIYIPANTLRIFSLFRVRMLVFVNTLTHSTKYLLYVVLYMFRDETKSVVFNPKYHREQWWILNWGERQWDLHFIRMDWNQYIPNKLEKSKSWVRRKLRGYYRNLKVVIMAWSGGSGDEEDMGFKYDLGGRINRTGEIFFMDVAKVEEIRWLPDF